MSSACTIVRYACDCDYLTKAYQKIETVTFSNTRCGRYDETAY